MLASLGFWPLVILLGVLVLLFGTARFGHAIRGLRIGGRELRRELRRKDELPPPDA